MPSSTIPLAVPDELYEEIKTAASHSQLSAADVMCQTMKLGLPKFREQFSPVSGLTPFTPAECKAAFGPDAEFDALEKARAGRTRKPPEAD